MAQIFHRSANTLAPLTIVLVLLLGGGAVGGFYLFNKSPFVTRQNIVADQPVPFSHEHHVRGLGLDCRFCHTSVETGRTAGMPPTYTCMTCHSQVWTKAAILEPIRESLAKKQPVHWQRVHDLPDFAFFDHSIHVNKGVGCVSCHGQVDKMPLPWRAQPLTMEWCLDCHRHPEQNLRPRDKITDMDWQPENQQELGPKLIQQNGLETSLDRITNCSTCHR